MFSGGGIYQFIYKYIYMFYISSILAETESERVGKWWHDTFLFYLFGLPKTNPTQTFFIISLCPLPPYLSEKYILAFCRLQYCGIYEKTYLHIEFVSISAAILHIIKRLVCLYRA